MSKAVECSASPPAPSHALHNCTSDSCVMCGRRWIQVHTCSCVRCVAELLTILPVRIPSPAATKGPDLFRLHSTRFDTLRHLSPLFDNSRYSPTFFTISRHPSAFSDIFRSYSTSFPILSKAVEYSANPPAPSRVLHNCVSDSCVSVDADGYEYTLADV